MKKLSFLVIFSLFGLLWVASANPSKNTREEMGLKGEVSSLVIKTVQMEIKFHKAEESESSYIQSYRFDRSGNVIETSIKLSEEEIKYKYKYEDGRLVSLSGPTDSYAYTYDEKGNKKEEIYKNKNGRMLERTEFKSDAKGNCIYKATYNELSCLSVSKMKYDSNGNLVECVKSEEDGEDKREVYHYNKDNLPEKVEVYNEKNKLIESYTYKYVFDPEGNWVKRLKMEKGQTLPIEIAKREFTYWEKAAAPLSTNRLLQTFVECLAAALCLCMIGHMLFVIYKGKRYKVVFTPDYFQAKRNELGLPQTETEEELDKQVGLLEQAFQIWTRVPDMEEEYRKPTKMKQIKASAALLDEVIGMHPLDPGIIERLNELTDVINSAESRSFSGSKTIVVTGFLIAAFFTYTDSGSAHFIRNFFTSGFTIWGPAIVYILASRKPQFLIDKKIMADGGKSHSLLFASLAGLVGAAHTVRTVTKWSDGTRTVDDDNSQHFFAWIISLFIMVMVAALMWIWAILNYLRNYIFYY